MKQFIWPRATKDGTFFTAMLLMTSIHLDGMYHQSLSPLSTALKLEAMRLVRERIQVPTRDSIINCISAIACLATCALVCECYQAPHQTPARGSPEVRRLALPSPENSTVRAVADTEQVREEVEAAEEYITHRNAYAVLIRQAIRMNMFEDSRFCKDILRIITVIA